MNKPKKHWACVAAAVFIVLAIAPSADALDLSDLNPFGRGKPLARITGRIKPPNMRQSWRKMNQGTRKVFSGTRDILFPWTASQPRMIAPPPPTGTRRVYPASNRPSR